MNQLAISDELTDTRSFYLSFTYQPYDWSETAFEETVSFIGKHSDMIFHYFDDGVPWDEASTDSRYHENVESLLSKRIENINDKQKVAVGLNFLDKNRKTLAGYWGATDGLPRPGKWNRLSINHPDVIDAYVSYCRSMIQRFKPDYFIYGMEVDSVELDVQSAEFRALESMVSIIYEMLREEFPKLPLVLTFMLAPEEDMDKRKLMVERLLPYSDIYAVSFYPYLFDEIGGDSDKIPPNLISRVRSYIGNKPFAIAETGFNAKTWHLLNRFIWVPGSETSQANFVSFLLNEANSLNAVFVNWWVPRDLDRLWAKMKDAGADPVLSQWNSNGLVDSEGIPRKGLKVWMSWQDKPIRNR
ncbi:MAG: hypothetical protein K1562_16170 [Candidatus Thiodiazotropha sp. (ex. Lucinisca nassula)]|nr:hypothetical protein [Candidatus Thiodiazotropha sp. (ex. Lucinisca nassula)]